MNLGSSANETAKGSGSRLCLVGPECQEGYARAMGVGWSPKICVASKVKGSVDKGSLNSNMRSIQWFRVDDVHFEGVDNMQVS